MLAALISLILALFFLGQSVRAQPLTDPAAIQAEIAALDSVSEHKELPCPETLPEKDHLVVAFDGMKGFCPLQARFFLPRWNDSQSLSDYAYATRAPEEYQKLKDRVLAEENFFHKCYFFDPILEALGTLQNRLPVLYYSRRGYREARSCVLSLQALAERAGRTLKISVTGYSLGGAAALRLSQALASHGKAVEKLLTVDPVGNNLRALRSTIFRGGSPRFFKKSKTSVPSWTNFYQAEDKRSISHGFVIPLGIRGNPVEGATNTRLSLGSEGHLQIVRQTEIVDGLRELLQDPDFPLPELPPCAEDHFDTPEN